MDGVDIRLDDFVSLRLYVKMPITRGYETILKDLDEYKERLSDDWQRVQFKRNRAKKESAKTFLKGRMDLILRTILKLQSIRGTLVRIHETHGNSVERQRGKEEVESRIVDLEKLMLYFSKF